MDKLLKEIELTLSQKTLSEHHVTLMFTERGIKMCDGSIVIQLNMRHPDYQVACDMAIDTPFSSLKGA